MSASQYGARQVASAGPTRLLHLLFGLLALALLNACATDRVPPLEAMDRTVDLERFMGDWYVIGFIPITLPFFSEDGAHNGVESYRLTAEGEWGKGRPVFDDIARIWGQTLGLISFGNIATAMARRAKAFGMHVIAYDPFVSELVMTGEGVEPVTTLAELLARSDYVSQHVPLNASTERMLGAEQFAQMKPSAVFINVGRGPTVDEPALIAALQSGQIAAAGLDVFYDEPVDPANPLLHMDNVMVTPHVASATARMMPEARRRLGRELATVLGGRWPRSAVNPEVLPRTKLRRWQPMLRGGS